MTEPETVSFKTWLAFTAMAIGMFFAILDIQIVASSLLELRDALDIPTDDLSWVQTSYLVAEIITIAMTGWLTRVMSTRWLFTTAMLGFVIASIGCALAESSLSFLVLRFVQGLFGGAIIPIVFSAAFTMFPRRTQGVATAIGGGLAMLAPTIGPFIGGWLTTHYSWHWLFLINVGPGLVVAFIVAKLVHIDRPNWTLVKSLDAIGLAAVAVTLGSLELTLREAPRAGWTAPWSLAMIAVLISACCVAVRRCVTQREPVIFLTALKDRTFATGCAFSFILGMGLFGAVYLMPLYLGFVHSYGPLQIGTVMVVMGAAQLVVAPLAAWAEQHVNLRLMTAAGFALLAAGLIWNGFATPAWRYDELFWPQVVRGAAVMICLVPTASLALGQLPQVELPNGSALFNLMRNLGGAVGLAMIDTLVSLRMPIHTTLLTNAIAAQDPSALAFTGAPKALALLSPKLVEDWINRGATVMAYNEAWLLLGGLAALSVLLVPLCRPPKSGADGAPGLPH